MLKPGGVLLEVVRDDNLLYPFFLSCRAVGRARGGGKSLRWAAFLKMMDSAVAAPVPTGVLPPCLNLHCQNREPILTPQSKWGQAVLAVWHPVTVSAGLQRASRGLKSSCLMKSSDIGQNAQGQVCLPTGVSPFLRAGVISPRQALEAGVRFRDLLWREFSFVCWRIAAPLARGSPVVPALGTAALSCSSSSLFSSTDEAFDMWCLGKTGGRLVDAGMRQLWCEGWMPRRIRLVCAACLVEGLGVSWTRGRDWFAHTLIDHDPVINTMMWQNAGLCGVDPFYRGVKWETVPDTESEELYVAQWADREVQWPKYLNRFASAPPPDWHRVHTVAHERRRDLRPVLAASARLCQAGVRVQWGRGDSEPGPVVGVGRADLHSFCASLSACPAAPAAERVERTE